MHTVSVEEGGRGEGRKMEGRGYKQGEEEGRGARGGRKNEMRKEKNGV